MKIDFERVYFDEVGKYILFKSKPEEYYLIRVMDFNGGLRFGETISNPEIIEKGSCVTCEYLLTKEEFEMWDTNEEAFHTLVDTLSTNAPLDRLLKMYFQHTPQSAPVPLKPNPGVPTSTEPNLVEEMQTKFRADRKAISDSFKDFLDGKNNLDIYFIHSNHLSKIFPAIDFEGKIFFVEGEEEAKKITEATAMFGNQYYKVTSDEAKGIIKNCKKYGVFRIIFCKPDGTAIILDRDVLLNEPTEDKWETYNSPVYNAFIRCIECAGIENPQVKANQMTLTSQLSHHIFKTAFLVAVNLPDFKDKETVLMSTGANNLYKENKFAFYGGEKFKYITSPETNYNIVTLVNTKDKSYALPTFTDIEEFRSVFPENSSAVPMAVTIEEVYSMRNEACNVIIINPSTLGFIFSEEAMTQLRELSKKPVTVFKPKTEESIQSQEKETTISIPEVPQVSSTADILQIVANQIKKDEAVKKENIVSSDKQDSSDELTDDVVQEQTTEEETEVVESAISEEEIKPTKDETSENQEVKSDNKKSTEKKGGFFSRFKRKK
ncbi:MAG: SseB family protein [Acutalibacteraceae bacterium]|nr:SseB family protein [Acutalibacteraceae bacterium]